MFSMFRSTLLRYNFRILMHHSWWLLVIPLAASQLTVFFTLVTQRFAESLPANTVETVSPLLAAFLCAHLLAAEYRSGIGAVLASKPVHIGKVVVLRLGIVMSLVWGLGFLSLAAFYFGMKPYPVVNPAVACIVSSLFLGMLALTFATMFRHPLAGFGVAALYWLFDMPPGPPLNPYLSLRSLTSSYPTPGVMIGQSLTDEWWVSKLILVCGIVALYLLHTRLLFTLGSPLTARRRQRTLTWAAGILAFYLISGAAVKVEFGYRHRGRLFPDDVVWFRRQFGPYGPLPIAALFGPNFRSYLGDIPNSWRVQQDNEVDLFGDTDQHRHSLALLIARAPDSIWAPSVAELIARLNVRAGTPVDEQTSHFRWLIDRYPNSPYTALALVQIAHIYADATENDPRYEAKARAAYEALLARFPVTENNSDAYGFLAESDRRHKDNASAELHTQKWVETAPIQEKFRALMLLADIRRDEGKVAAAKEAARQAIQAVQEFRRAKQSGGIVLTVGKLVRSERDADEVDQRASRF